MAAIKTHFQQRPGSAYQWVESNYSPLLPLGNVFYVNSTSGTNATGRGFSPEAPFATIAYAITKCTAGQNDLILVMPGHTESVTGAGTIAMSKSDVTIRGMGPSNRGCVITLSTGTDAQITVTGARCRFENITIDFTGIDAIVAGISVTAADVVFDGCDFVISEGTKGVVLGILTAATAARLKVLKCRFLGPATSTGTTTTACIKHEVGVDYEIRGNYFTGKMTQAILNATALLRGLIAENYFVIATGTVGITMHASSTPFISNNRFNVASGTAPIVAAAGFVSGNNYSAAAGVTAGTASTF